MTEPQREDVIRCEGIWKIFGDKSQRAMDAIRTQGLSKRDILRCLKRYILREAHAAIMKDLALTA